MSSLIWISGASGGIGQALVRTVPWPDARIIGISRREAPGIETVQADLSDPGHWERVALTFAKESKGFAGNRAVFIHAAGTLDPIGFAGEVSGAAYLSNVVVNSAAPQALGHLFLAETAGLRASRHLVMLTSGAAKSVYPGWSSYGAGKAAIDQWVRDVGAEQDLRGGGAEVLAIAPGTIDTGMQAELRATDEADFPSRQKFVDLHAAGKLTPPDEAAAKIWGLVGKGLPNGSIIDLRDPPKV